MTVVEPLPLRGCIKMDSYEEYRVIMEHVKSLMPHRFHMLTINKPRPGRAWAKPRYLSYEGGVAFYVFAYNEGGKVYPVESLYNRCISIENDDISKRGCCPPPIKEPDYPVYVIPQLLATRLSQSESDKVVSLLRGSVKPYTLEVTAENLFRLVQAIPLGEDTVKQALIKLFPEVFQPVKKYFNLGKCNNLFRNPWDERKNPLIEPRTTGSLKEVSLFLSEQFLTWEIVRDSEGILVLTAIRK